MTEEEFVSFLCGSCHTEIEATCDMIGETTECPACGAKIRIPDTRPQHDNGDGIIRHGQDSESKAKTQALKGRTIRIELGDF